MPIRPENANRYPENWPDISQRIRFERAGGRCEFEYPLGSGQRCTALHGQPHPDTGSIVVLTVAHLDHTPENCDDDNLLAGCQRCHLNYDRPNHRDNRKYNRDERLGQQPLFGWSRNHEEATA